MAGRTAGALFDAASGRGSDADQFTGAAVSLPYLEAVDPMDSTALLPFSPDGAFDAVDHVASVPSRWVRGPGPGRTIVSTTPGHWDVYTPHATVRVSIVIPARNEADNLATVLKGLPPHLHQVVLVDGASTDDTVAVARAAYPDIQVVRQTGRGKGDALRLGFEACDGDIVVMLDADGSMTGAEIAPIVVALCQGADFVKGSRFLHGGGSSDLTLVRRIGNWLLRTVVNVLFGTQYTDLCYGYIGFWTRFAPIVRPDCDGFEVESLMNVRAAAAGLHVMEIPSIETPRLHGRSKLHAWRDGWRVLRTVVREWFSVRRYHPFVGGTGTAPLIRSEAQESARAQQR